MGEMRPGLHASASMAWRAAQLEPKPADLARAASDSVLAGLGAFFFSAVVITLFGEIAPQAYFSRNALRMTARFLPFLIFWRAALFFLVQPTAMLLDLWLGIDGISYLRARDVRSLV